VPVNAGARLDRLPISSFHVRILWLIGAGMFFVEILVVLALGAEPRRRRLEDIEAEPAVGPFPAEARNP
jgi:hypothetical protein